MPVTTDRSERRRLRDRRHNAVPDLHERLENKRMAIECERRHLIRRDVDRISLPARMHPAALEAPLRSLGVKGG
jgi:hypothetical protein